LNEAVEGWLLLLPRISSERYPLKVVAAMALYHSPVGEIMPGVALRKQNTFAQPSSNREAVLARYRRLREISTTHHSKAMEFLSKDAFLHQARRLGLAAGKKIVCDKMEELILAFDLAIHTAPAGRSRAIDRYARSAAFAPGSDEALVLEAMRHARFAIVSVEGRHPSAGLVVTELAREAEHWLVDEGLEKSLQAGSILATRYFEPEQFCMTAGISVPVNPVLLEDAILSAPQLLHKSLRESIEDRRFAEALYRFAIADGIMEGVTYQDLDYN
jgi:hypothetical protein